jgi:hypothetical protein
MAEVASLSLSTLLVPSKATTVDFPGYPGFEVELSFLSREELIKIRKKATTISFKKRQPVEELNDELFLSLYCQATIKGWKGLKLAYVSQLAPVDLTGKNLEDTLGFSQENALALMKSSGDFDSFVSETVADLQNFQ